MDDSKLIEKTSCPSCGSSDANAVYTDGHTFCFSCNTHKKAEGQVSSPAPTPSVVSGLAHMGEAIHLVKRKVGEDICKKFAYTTSEYNGSRVQIANYKKDGKVVAQKVRFPNKEFVFLGDTKNAGLYGQHLWRNTGGKMLVITEGEVDAISVAQANGGKYPVVSLPTGASGAVRAIKRELEFVSSYEKVVLMFDNDEAGQKATQEVAQLLKPNQAHIAELPMKDASDMLMAGKAKDIINLIWEAKAYRPDGIINAADLLEEVLSIDTTESVDYPWEDLNIKTRGLRKGELTVFTAGSGVGKSAVVREIAFDLLKNDYKVGMIMLEESVKRTALGMVALELNAPIHLDRDLATDEQITNAFNTTMSSGNLFLYDHFGSVSSDNLMDRIRYLATGCDCDFIVLDHISIAVSDPSFQDHGLDERKTIDMLMTRCRSLVEELGIGLIPISHLRRPEGKGHEEGASTSLSQLRSSHSIAQLADMVIGLERNQQDPENANITTMRILKNRFSGETGEATKLNYEPKTGRLFQHNVIPEGLEIANGDVFVSDY